MMTDPGNTDDNGRLPWGMVAVQLGLLAMLTMTATAVLG
jgi:hypothetical protein